jgi:hypothetical protein
MAADALTVGVYISDLTKVDEGKMSELSLNKCFTTQQNLAQYKQVFTEAIEREFPLNQQARQNLENLQKSLRLREEDVTGIKQPFLQQAEIRD